MNNARDISVFVLLGHDFGANTWQRKQSLGQIPGLNDQLAYGYHRARGRGWSIEYSHDRNENVLSRFARLSLRKVLGFDLIHVFHNRTRLFQADIVWTHTELENLAALVLFRLKRRRLSPALIANCVWLFDRWPRLSRLRQAFYRGILRHASLITTQSPENLRAARGLFPDTRSELVLWGALTDEMSPPRREQIGHPIRIASLGNDMHRDWQTLLSAFGNADRYELRIGSSRLSRKRMVGLRNVTIVSPKTADEVRSLYEWSDIVVVPLKPNLHASGLTVIFESISCGIPVISTDVGGLRAYFSDREMTYVPAFAPVAMRAAVNRLSENDDRRIAVVANAQHRVRSADLTTRGFAIRNRQLSADLLRANPRYS